jgi:hypothetical protein
MSGKATTFLEEVELHDTSGTSAEPNSTPTPIPMTMRGDWMLMFHANAFVANTQQTSHAEATSFSQQTGSCLWRSTRGDRDR